MRKCVSGSLYRSSGPYVEGSFDPEDRGAKSSLFHGSRRCHPMFLDYARLFAWMLIFYAQIFLHCNDSLANRPTQPTSNSFTDWAEVSSLLQTVSAHYKKIGRETSRGARSGRNTSLSTSQTFRPSLTSLIVSFHSPYNLSQSPKGLI
jgi:hypothetical protein